MIKGDGHLGHPRGGFMSVDGLLVELTVDKGSRDDEQRSLDTDYLVAELSQLDLDRMELRSGGPAPLGTRGAGAVEIGSVVVALASAKPALGALLGLVQDWLARRQSGTVRIKIGDDELELTFASQAAQKQALDAFVDRHAR